MSNWLSNVVARSAGHAELVQPRTRSLFEPPARQAWPGTEIPSDLASADESPQVAEPSPQLVPPSRTVVQQASNVAPIRPPKSTTMLASMTEADNAPANELRPQTPAAVRPPIQMAVPPGESVRPLPPPSPSAGATGASNLVQPSPETTSLPAAGPQLVVSPRSTGSPPATSSRRPTESPAAAGRPDETAKTESSASVVRPQVMPRLEPLPLVEPQLDSSRDGFVSNRDQESGPTINVTIGRIEVRALPPEPPKHRQRTPAPVLSLDEYLRQRAEGRR